VDLVYPVGQNVPIRQQAEHLGELRDGYGEVQPERLLDAIVTKQTETAEPEAINAQPRVHAHSPAPRQSSRYMGDQ
jgi:hypothetical protein